MFVLGRDRALCRGCLLLAASVPLHACHAGERTELQLAPPSAALPTYELSHAPAAAVASAPTLPVEFAGRNFSCRKNIFGKRPSGDLTLTFTVQSARAQLRMKFDSAWCPFEAVWRFPEGVVGGALAQRPGFKPTCEGSPLSPFALGCDLNGPTRLGSSAYALRSELHVMASGSDVIRRIGFVDDWPSDPIAVPPPKDCPLVPLQYDERTQQSAANLRLLPEFAWFDETECKLE